MDFNKMVLQTCGADLQGILEVHLPLLLGDPEGIEKLMYELLDESNRTFMTCEAKRSLIKILMLQRDWSDIDPLTSLFTVRKIKLNIIDLIRKHLTDGEMGYGVFVIFIDYAFFKIVNDGVSYAFGSSVLSRLANIMRHNARHEQSGAQHRHLDVIGKFPPGYTVDSKGGRLGGDESVVTGYTVNLPAVMLRLNDALREEIEAIWRDNPAEHILFQQHLQKQSTLPQDCFCNLHPRIGGVILLLEAVVDTYCVHEDRLLALGEKTIPPQENIIDFLISSASDASAYVKEVEASGR
jgi:GGDEF domain-containing protein